MPFEWLGSVFFLTLGFLHWKRKDHLLKLAVTAGLGAETLFILIQKYEIGSWCPVCLSIAAIIALIGICYFFLKEQAYHEDRMNKWFQIGLLTAAFSFGFGSSFFGVSKIDQLQAVEDAIKERIKFGNPSSGVQVYVFTDWACPACRMAEPAIEAMGPKVMKNAQLIFVDTVVHPATLNYAPYNISFMANNKTNYFRIREALGKLSVKTKKPSEQEVNDAVAPFGAHYVELPFEDVTAAMRYFEELTDKFKITATPTIAIVNTSAKKGKKLAGIEEITEANVLKAIKSIQ